MRFSVGHALNIRKTTRLLGVVHFAQHAAQERWHVDYDLRLHELPASWVIMGNRDTFIRLLIAGEVGAFLIFWAGKMKLILRHPELLDTSADARDRTGEYQRQGECLVGRRALIEQADRASRDITVIPRANIGVGNTFDERQMMNRAVRSAVPCPRSRRQVVIRNSQGLRIACGLTGAVMTGERAPAFELDRGQLGDDSTLRDLDSRCRPPLKKRHGLQTRSATRAACSASCCSCSAACSSS